MNWDEILKYRPIIVKIASKYSGDPDLRDDVVSEVMLKLYEDKKLDTNRFEPSSKDAAIRTVIRNKTIKVLRSKRIGRFPMDSLDTLIDVGFQVDADGALIYPDRHKSPNNYYDFTEDSD